MPVTNPKYPRKPSRILTTAFKMAMAITLALARDRATGKSRPLYFGLGKRIIGMAEVWKRAKKAYLETVIDQHPDASVLLKVEHVLRRSYSRILLKTSVKYGNTETKRVKREEGNKGYLNILWDYAGSRIRDVVKARFIFPKPVPIERSDELWTHGYHGSTKTPVYPVRHNHLPELDFGDMVRSPLMELARQCLKYGVPIREAKKYIDALLYRLIPFMDYVYTERRSGRPNYVRDGLKELRIVVDQIKREHGTRNGQRQSITSEIQESVPYETLIEVDMGKDDTVDSIQGYLPDVIDSGQEDKSAVEEEHFLQEAVTAAKDEGVVLDDFLDKAEKLLNNDTLTTEDSLELLKQAKEQSRRIGKQIHNFVAKNFQSPFSLNGVIYHGTEMVYDDSGLVLFSEVSIDRGRGRVDFVLARAKQLTRVDGAPSPVFCEPFLIVDLKTKSAFDFDIYGMESRSKEENNVISEFVLERRGLTNDEWENVLSSTPIKYERDQLDAYETFTLADYQNVMRNDVDAQKNLAKAVIVADSFQSWKDISEAILPLVLRAYNGCVDGTLSEGDFLFPFDEERRLKIAMKMLSVARPVTDTVSLDTPIPLKPFSKRVQDHKEFILYLTIPGSGSPAQSAAVIAERWHGLEYLHSLAQKRHRDVYLLDLVGEYKDPILRKKQFRLRFQTDSIKRFFKRRVQVKDLSSQIKAYIYEGEPISTLRTRVHDLLRKSRHPIIVVSGWEILRKSTPDSFDKYLDEIASTIMQALPYKCTILWFARPVPIAQNSTTYSTRCVAPFYQGTLWQNLADVIVWNVVMPPDRTGARAPTNDHERGIFIERPGKSLERKMIDIKPLRGWGEDFRSGGHKSKMIFRKGIGSSPTPSSRYIEKQLDRATELIPHLLHQSEYNLGPRLNSSLDIEQVPSGYYTPQDLQPMLSFKPTQVYTLKKDDVDFPKIEIDGRVKILLPIASINRRREYRQMALDVPSPKRTTRPPSEHFLSVSELDDRKIMLTEIGHLKDTVRFLKRVNKKHLEELLDKISEALGEESNLENTNTLMNRLRFVHQILETNTLSKVVWERLLQSRSIIPRDLTNTQEKYVSSIQKKHPDILLMTGNHLFLLILAALGPIPDIAFTETLRFLWDYVRPWHLIGLGFTPVYPKNHSRGRSVLDRHRILTRLQQRIIDHNKSLEQQISLTNVKFGQLIVLPHSGTAGSAYFWLLFQRKPGIYDMNAALLNPRGIESSISPIESLQEMVAERTYWSESDLILLSRYAKLQGNEVRVPVMIADQRGQQILWVGDRERQRWNPIGRVHYTTRRFEDVTLVRTISLSTDPHLQPYDYDNVRQSIHQPEDMVDTALLILNRGLEGCTPASCEVTLDVDEDMYRVTFVDQESDDVLGAILINRTVDLLEILRRPDNDCEPVIINGKRLIWNRFRDISYDGDVALIRPWVNRREPFPGMALDLPHSASDLLNARKEFDITLEVYHDPWTCSLRSISFEAIYESHRRTQALGPQYMFRYARPWGEPERISNEPGIDHGLCWRIHVDTPQPLTPELRELMEVRFTDAQARSLLSPQELVYQSRKNEEWVTHTFKIEAREECIREIKESWHLRTMLEELTGDKLEPSIPGTYLQNPDQWSPYIIIKSECVVVGLRERGTGRVEEGEIREENVALRSTSEVQNLLEHEMEEFLEERGILGDRRLTAAIRTEIEDTIEEFGVGEGGAEVEFDGVTIEYDSAGGRVIYVFLTSEDETHKVQVTGHLHDYGRFRPVRKDDFEGEVISILQEFNLSEEDEERAVRKCVRLMRKEGLIKR